jgi:cation:H+ antiporter
VLLNISLLIGGTVLLLIGAELLVRGSTRLAVALGMTPLLAGLIVASIGTSSPELTVSVGAALNGLGDLAVANVIGSNVANIALILGLCAVIRPISVHVQLVRVDIPVMMAVTGLGIALLWNGLIGRLEGALLIAGLIAYLVWSVRAARRSGEGGGDSQPAADPRRTVLFLVMSAGGIGLLIGGGMLLIDGSTSLARQFGLSERVIGVTIVAVGTSLPELATSIVATIRRELDVAVGNVVGSNIFNILGILGIAAVVSPLAAHAISVIDVVALALTALILFPLVRSGFRISRLEGVALLVGYVVFVVITVV